MSALKAVVEGGAALCCSLLPRLGGAWNDARASGFDLNALNIISCEYTHDPKLIYHVGFLGPAIACVPCFGLFGAVLRPLFAQVAGIVGSGSLHALEVDTEGAVQDYKAVRMDGVGFEGSNDSSRLGLLSSPSRSCLFVSMWSLSHKA